MRSPRRQRATSTTIERVDPDAVLAQLRRKTRRPGRMIQVRKERAMLYYLDDGAG